MRNGYEPTIKARESRKKMLEQISLQDSRAEMSEVIEHVRRRP